MNKPVFGLLLGGVLGIFDGLSAMVSAPETRPAILGIVIGSTMKGVIAGLAIGYFARKVKSLPLGILFGLIVGGFLAFLVARMQGKYYLEIILPGSLVGVIVGYATQKHREAARVAAAALLLLLLAAPALQAQTPAKAAFQTETLFPGTDHEMLTLYFLAGGELRATHYCAMGNQPLFRFDPAASKPDELVFAFAGGTGFDPAKDQHVHNGVIGLKGDRLENDWAFWNGGKQEGDHRFFLQRAR